MDRLMTLNTARLQEMGRAEPSLGRSMHTILAPTLYISRLKGIDRITVRVSPSSPKRARATGKPIKPLLQKVAQQHHIPRRSWGTRSSRDSPRDSRLNRGKATAPTRKMEIPSLKKPGSKGRSMEWMMVAGTVTFISRVLMGLEDSAGSSLARTAKKPTPMSRNSPTRLENRTDRSMGIISLFHVLFMFCLES